MASNARTSLVCVSDIWQAPWYTACANCSVFPVWEWYTISNVFTGAHVQIMSQPAASPLRRRLLWWLGRLDVLEQSCQGEPEVRQYWFAIQFIRASEDAYLGG